MRTVLLPLLSLLLVSCQATNHESVTQSAYPNLDPLVEQVAQARDAQLAAVQQFQATREQLAELANYGGGDLSAMVAATVTEHDAAVQAAVAMSSSIDAVEQTANALFQQWQIETEVYTDARLKTESQSKLAQTWQSYEGYQQVLRQSAAQVDTVLAALNDNVVSLQDNATATRNVELSALVDDIGALIQQLNNTIARADAFIASVQP